MTFDLNYTFNLPLAAGDVTSDYTENGNFDWRLCWRLQTAKRRLIIFTEPIEDIIRPDVDWSVEVDVKGKVGTTSFTKKNAKMYSKTENGKRTGYGSYLFEKKEENFVKEYETPEKTVQVSIEISNIRTKGLRKFPTIDYGKSDSRLTDLTVTIKDKTVHSHSQIMSFNSTVFRGLIEGKTAPYEITLEDSIVYEDFLELLHHIYHPAEVIDEQNLGTVLPLAKQFETTQILELCQRFMEKYLSDCSVDKSRKIEFFLSAWKYDLDPLKMSCFGNVFPCRDHELLSLFDQEIYEVMNEKQTTEMLQYIIRRSEGTLVSQ